ncbi:Nuclear migration protein NUM1 [Sphaceloma murrayae]|uniref:Nuclear migration protein NUM1 n=1 Tax=Sphaceloma murrayae TaxID=2082308 RepID=A0A2K1QR04_9PEZI|nr:Nuclear migration protein NUM1 [Sphaceloma murrayae]
MATQFYAHSESFRPPSPTDSGTGQPENSWYRHSSQTADLPSARPSSPGASNPRSFLFNDTNKSASSLDPRRITPTLHASLVSEILSLRREIETKNAFIDDLETNLHSTKLEVENVNDRLSQTIRESRTSKKQADDAEKHLYQVTEDLIKERDEALSNGEDLRSKLNTITSRSRRQEQDFEQWQRDWERKNQTWEIEKRNLELRAKTTENQLRAVVQELNTANTRTRPGNQQTDVDGAVGNETPLATPISPKSRHRRNVSSLSAQSSNFLLSTPPRDYTAAQLQGKSLADELDSDADDDLDLRQIDTNDDPLLDTSLPRNPESPSKARKVLGLDVPNIAHETLADPDLITEPSSQRPLSGIVSQAPPEDYFTSWQRAQQMSMGAVEEARSPIMTTASTQTDSDSHLFKPFRAESSTGADEESPIDGGLRKVGANPHLTSQTMPASYKDVGIQFEANELPNFAVTPSTPVTDIDASVVPHIAIHPPSTAPPSPRTSTVLPPQTASAATQTDPRMTSKTADANVQTEEIRIDLRKFRAHLQVDSDNLSAQDIAFRHISYESQQSRDTIPSVSVQEMATNLNHAPVELPGDGAGLAKSPNLIENRSSSGDARTQSSFWGGQSARSSSLLMSLHDDGQGIKSGHSSVLARELRKSNLSETSTTNDTYMLPTAPLLRYTSDHGRQSGERWSDTRNSDPHHKDRDPASVGMRTSFRSRASSIDTVESSVFSVSSQPPPIPIPDRSSSRIHADILEEELSGSGYDGSPKRRITTQSAAKPSGVRKTRSSNSIKRNAQTSPKRRRRAANRLAPIKSIAYDDDLDIINNLYTPIEEEHPSITSSVPAVNFPAQQPDDRDTPLVDSIAAAMVGEWMWKYPQKRRSFGMTDNGKDSVHEGKDATRQRRWVWISPYERTVMWSSKQPVGGSQLLGSKGRKLLIKTVLDVADPSPLPKGSNYATCYSRSIVILTPDRPLKITASNRDRHYHWLMALSFLASPSQGMPNVPRVPNRKTVQHNGYQDVRREDGPGHVRSETLEHKDSVINASISKASASQLGLNTIPGRNFSAPASTHPYPNSAQNTKTRVPLSPAFIPAPQSTSLNTLVYNHPDMPLATPDIQTHRFRRGSNVSSTHSQTKQNQSSRRDSHSQSSPNDPMSSRLASLTHGEEPELDPSHVHTRRRSTTNPVRLPTTLTDLKPFSSRRPTLTSPTFSPPGPSPPTRTPATVRMTAFIDPASASSQPLSPGLARPLPPSPDELARNERDRRPGAVGLAPRAQTPRQEVPTNPSFNASLQSGQRTPLINAHFPGLEAAPKRAPTPSPLPSLRMPTDFDANGRSWSANGNGNANHGAGLASSTLDPSLGTETTVQGGDGGWRRNFNPAAATSVGEGMNGFEEAAGGEKERSGGSRAESRTGSGLGASRAGMGLVTGLRRRGMGMGMGLGFGMGGLGKGSDAESVRSGRSVRSDATRNTDDRRRLGYVFDEEGRDPFRGF